MSFNPNPSDKLHISFEDTQTHRTEAIVEQFRRADEYVTVREVGAPMDTRSNATILSILMMAGAGVAGGVLSFLLVKLANATFIGPNTGVWVSNISFTFVMAFSIGLAIAMADAASERSAAKVGRAAAVAVPAAIGFGLAVGALTHFIYSNWIQSVYDKALAKANAGEITSEAQFYDYITSQSHLPRGVAWAFVGISVGLTIGVASRSSKRLLLTTVGGLVGGFLGGFTFDYLPSEGAAQILGMTLTGLLVGLSMALVEQARKARWIEIVTGGMAGKQFILYKNELTLGSSPAADITLIKDPSIPPIAARLVFAGGRSFLYSMDPNVPANVENRTGTQFALQDASQITIGSTTLRYRERVAGAGQEPDRIQRL